MSQCSFVCTQWFHILHMVILFFLHAVKWVQALLFNTNNSIQHYWFIYTQSNSSKYCYVISIIQFLHTVNCFQVFEFNTNNHIQHLFAVIQFHIVKLFQILLCITNNSMLVGCLLGFYGISTFVGYLMPNPFLWKYFDFKQFSLA